MVVVLTMHKAVALCNTSYATPSMGDFQIQEILQPDLSKSLASRLMRKEVRSCLTLSPNYEVIRLNLNCTNKTELQIQPW